MRSHQRRIEPLPEAIVSTSRYGQRTQDQRAARGETFHSSTGPLLSGPYYSVVRNPRANSWPSDMPKYASG